MADKSASEVKVQNYVFVLIATMWAIGIAADILSPNFNLPIEVTAVVGAIVSYFIADRKKQEKKTRRRR